VRSCVRCKNSQYLTREDSTACGSFQTVKATELDVIVSRRNVTQPRSRPQLSGPFGRNPLAPNRRMALSRVAQRVSSGGPVGVGRSRIRSGCGPYSYMDSAAEM